MIKYAVFAFQTDYLVLITVNIFFIRNKKAIMAGETEKIINKFLRDHYYS